MSPRAALRGLPRKLNGVSAPAVTAVRQTRLRRHARRRTMRPVQLTLAIIKPHVLKNPVAHEALRNVIAANEFRVLRCKRELLSRARAQDFYSEHRHKFFYNRLITFMCSDASEFLILAKNNAIADWRALLGPTRVYQAQFSAPDCVRARFGLSDTRNAAHGSDGAEAARREIGLFFPDFEVRAWPWQ